MMDASYGYGGSGGGGGGNVAQTLMTLEQKIEAMEQDVKRTCICVLTLLLAFVLTRDPPSHTTHTHISPIHSSHRTTPQSGSRPWPPRSARARR